MLRTNLGYLGGLLGKFIISTGGHDLSMQHLMKHIKLRYITLCVVQKSPIHLQIAKSTYMRGEK